MIQKRLLITCAIVAPIVLLFVFFNWAMTPLSFTEEGIASWYGPGFNGKKTATGEIFNQEDFTAAHRKLPLGSLVRVTNQKNGASVFVRINDRGPYAKGRVIDLSRASAAAIGKLDKGIFRVRIEGLGRLKIGRRYKKAS